MINKKLSKKAHSVGSVMVVVALVISIFSFALYTGKNGNNVITGNAVGIGKVPI